MQLSFDLTGATPMAEARERLLSCFGSQRAAGRHDPVSQLVKSVVSSQTYDAVSGAAYARLRARYRDWSLLMRAPPQEIQALIADVTYAEKKAPALIAALNAIHAQKGRLTLDFLADLSSDDALAWLERLHGVGRKIAAAVVNFSTLGGYAFVIDTHVLRVSQRLGWLSPRAKTAERAYEPLMALAPADWDADDLYEMHWLMKRLGQAVCRFAAPDCRPCPLRSLCVHARPDVPPPKPSETEKPAVLEAPSNDNAADLRAQIAKFDRSEAGVHWGAAALGDARVDRCFPGGGLPLGRLHEICGEAMERETPAAATGFSALLAARTMNEGAVLWSVQRDDLHAPGLQVFGLDPDRLIFVRTDKDEQALSVVESALHTRGVSAVIGEVAALDLTASRRLQLVCERGGATAFIIRRRLYGAPRIRQKADAISAASTRWRIAPAPSAMDEPGLGPPRWAARLERCRGGRTGAWILEMQHAASSQTPGHVRVAAELADHAAEAGDGRAAAPWSAGLGDDGGGGERAASGRD